MNDREQAQQRLIILLRENLSATPYVVGYLTHEMSAEQMTAAVDAWFTFDERLEAARAGSRLAAEAPFSSPEVPVEVP